MRFQVTSCLCVFHFVVLLFVAKQQTCSRKRHWTTEPKQTTKCVVATCREAPDDKNFYLFISAGCHDAQARRDQQRAPAQGAASPAAKPPKPRAASGCGRCSSSRRCSSMPSTRMGVCTFWRRSS